MAQYVSVEYLIGKDGKITERVIGATGSSCQQTTTGIERALGEVTGQELLPEYYEDSEILTQSESQKTTQS
jgi:DNA-binding transcriptional regulator YdaS (Cro superfamily)